ncbi:dTMP kinase [Tepidibacillus infernus]|uniref:Thymidylate kinase n=1 Tax=Tepidibacillus decaturensis TaxID=1413211 RepID=A0A135L836_9BACI|nr:MULTISPECIES: dTMP kinase [Tepidibacillus]KXG45103.1 thymidylate kinase [Tepidibacillus decaturensis]GBF11425.1 thymidylate kinase [Tepidibacillus sp. HK-1]
MKGIFVSFEGPDGAGKTTQLHLLADYLISKGYDVVTTREPGGTFISDQIRHIILHPEHKELKDQTEVLLYAASRAQLVQEKIIPALNEGKIVLCDRYIDASIAYQAYGLGIERQTVQLINLFATSHLWPDRTYLLDIKPEVSKSRLMNRGVGEFGNGLDRIEQKQLEYHRRVYHGFLTLADEDPKRILKVEADQAKEGIFQVIKEDFIKILKKKEE